ncbi:hypothetical protein QAD02_020401 [Eretmocerus hayati]|uniref:Uncharacterized protein n=1 Tax=Eretmocerus hayati TaxID=131215 RepID=A0ACC2PMD9_9HYME|nr:hypothetical protein QAD02_020401 [Eretmocerus hayati]
MDKFIVRYVSRADGNPRTVIETDSSTNTSSVLDGSSSSELTDISTNAVFSVGNSLLGETNASHGGVDRIRLEIVKPVNISEGKSSDEVRLSTSDDSEERAVLNRSLSSDSMANRNAEEKKEQPRTNGEGVHVIRSALENIPSTQSSQPAALVGKKNLPSEYNLKFRDIGRN